MINDVLQIIQAIEVAHVLWFERPRLVMTRCNVTVVMCCNVMGTRAGD